MKATAFMLVLSMFLLSTAAMAGEAATEVTRTDVSHVILTDRPVSRGAKADVPGLMSYQGTLTDPSGVALDTTVDMAFSIYTDSTGGSLIWTETQTAVVVSSGMFNVLLGRVNSISDTVFKDPERWIGVQVGADPEADTAEYARSGGGGGGWVDDGSVIRLETDTDSVGIGTTSPKARLHVQAWGSIAVIGRRGTAGNSGHLGTEFAGVYGYDQKEMELGYGVWGESEQGWGVFGRCLDNGNYGFLGARLCGVKGLHLDSGNLGYLGLDSCGVFGYSETSYAGYFDGHVHVSGNMGIGTMNPIKKLHVVGDDTLGSVMIAPDESGTGDDAELVLAEDDDGTYSMNVKYDGGVNQLQIFGTSLSTLYGPHVVVERNSGDVGIGTTSPDARLDVAGGQWDLNTTEGDFKIGDDTYRLKMGVATGGGGAGSAGIRVQGGLERLILGAGSSEVLEIDTSGTVKIGSSSQDGYVHLYSNGTPDPVVRLGDSMSGAAEGSVRLYTPSGECHTSLLPVLAGGSEAGSIVLNGYGDFGPPDGIWLMGDDLSGEPGLDIFGSSRLVRFRMSETGTSSVVLPSDAISANEMFDEPGVASHTGSGITLTGGVEVQLSRSITCPTDGYVLVMGTCEVSVTHSTGTISNAYFGVSDVSTSFPTNQDIELRLSSAAPSASYDFPVTVHGLFQVGPGTNTFYFLAQEVSGAFITLDTQLSLVFVPTAYGTVSPTLAVEPSIPDEQAQRDLPLTPADISVEQAEAAAFNAARIGRELAAMRAELESLKREVENRNR
ncbi:MAG: hypothetical protein AMJ92_08080 [candidate division Zixibacteria bacterium SM23_81]|nr:MAG: hypothetical protein AMJ92_08080 [candidate division Zixibacteria bacterium SM23_81]